MKLLIVAATRAEIEPLLSFFDVDEDHFKSLTPLSPKERALAINLSYSFYIQDHAVDVLITGVGMVATAFALGHKFAHQQYDLAINLGIAGSFDLDLAMGDVVLVKQDVFADWGAEDGEEFLSIDALGFGECVQFGSLIPLKHMHLKEVRGITVNKAHGSELTIAQTIARLNPQVESMEGAAFFYACKQTSTHCVQIRSISNYVERRNREKWDINLAIKNLNEFAVNFLNRSLVLEVN